MGDLQDKITKNTQNGKNINNIVNFKTLICWDSSSGLSIKNYCDKTVAEWQK